MFWLKAISNFCSKFFHIMCVLLIIKRSIVIVIFVIPVPLLCPFWLYFLDTPLTKNDSRSRFPLPHDTEYFVDQKKYFYWILLHANAALLIGVVTILASGTILIVYQQYACGMFRIAR